jgi:hypothetical protein
LETDTDTDTDDNDDLFGHASIEHKHTLKSFMAYTEWCKAVHFGWLGRPETTIERVGRAAGLSSDDGQGGSWVDDDNLSGFAAKGRHPDLQSLRDCGDCEGAEDGIWGEGSPSVMELEAEFWRIVEDPSLDVETLYGSDLDSGR